MSASMVIDYDTHINGKGMCMKYLSDRVMQELSFFHQKNPYFIFILDSKRKSTPCGFTRVVIKNEVVPIFLIAKIKTVKMEN